MTYRVFCVYDSKIEAFMTPFIMQTKGQAMRSFGDTVNDSSTQFWKHPEDFTLFEIGTYDDREGVYQMHDAKISLGTALEFKEKATQRLEKVV